MAIVEVTMYQAACDLCGKKDDEGEFYAWADPSQAVDVACESEWSELVDGRLLCDSCRYQDDEEEE